MRRTIERAACTVALAAGLFAPSLARAQEGPGDEVRSSPPAPQAVPPPAPPQWSPHQWFTEAYRLRAVKDYAGAARAFEEARRAGGSGQRVDMELGYLALQRQRPGDAKPRFEAAAHGEDAAMAKQARAELKNLPARFWGELYADAVGWYRFSPFTNADLVPTLRLRALVRPSLNVDFHLYLFGQVTRDVASTGIGPGSSAVVFADDFAMLGAGALFRFWGARLGVFAQGGVAFDLINDGQKVVQPELRGGIFGAMSSAKCFPQPNQPASGFCGELYFEGIYVYRFNNNAILFARPRVGYTLFRTGPIAWQPMIEARAAVDTNGEYWNNFGEGGVVHRWRLLSPVAFDVILGIHGGGYFGRATAANPLPPSLGYAEARLVIATYLTTDIFRK
jgi:hypothetical protein